ncbi:hypothetical protein AB205_0150770, partial [Aquarana catesbeiana]
MERCLLITKWQIWKLRVSVFKLDSSLNMSFVTGNGVCKCRVCECFPNYSGSACDCSEDTLTCMASNGQLCNGTGICECGRCKCTDPKFHGYTCEICPTCVSDFAERNFVVVVTKP